MDSTLLNGFFGAVILAVVVVGVVLISRHRLTTVIGLGRSPRPAPDAPQQMITSLDTKKGIECDEEARVNIRILSDSILDRATVIDVAQLLVSYKRYRFDVPNEYSKACESVAAVAEQWLQELLDAAASGSTDANEKLCSLRDDPLPHNKELNSYRWLQSQQTAYEAFRGCGMPDLLKGT